jgi:hypothetical protein
MMERTATLQRLFDRSGRMCAREAAGQVGTSYAESDARDHWRVAEAPLRLFDVTCKRCGRTLATVQRIRDPEIDAIRDHVGRCARGERVTPSSPLGEILAHIRVKSFAG